MDNFVKRGASQSTQSSQSEPVRPLSTSRTTNVSPQAKGGNFLTDATAIRVDNNKDVGLDILGDMKDNLENVMEFFSLAKELDNVKGELQQLQFTEKFPLKEYRLIEVDKKLAEEFEIGEKLVFRGEVDDYVVLCSENRSFAVKEVETSNSLMLLPTLKMADELADDEDKHLQTRMVNAVSHHYFELKEIECVSLFRLRELLHEKELVWDWPEKDALQNGNTYTYDQLLDIVQMSEGQLRKLLDIMPVVQHQGCLRWLSYDYRDRFWELLVDLCDDDMNAPDVNIKMVTSSSLRKRFPENVSDSIIEWFLKIGCELTSLDDGSYRIMKSAIVRARASCLLRNVRQIEQDLFESQLEQILPHGVEIDLDCLTGLCSIEETFKGRFLSYLNVEDLPEDPRERLGILFERKSTWTMKQMSPYLTDICANAKSMSGLLVSHCRSTKNDQGEKVFCSLRAV